MKIRTLFRSLLLSMICTCLLVASGQAQYPAYDLAFATSVVYQNLSTSSPANLSFEFFEQATDTTPTISPAQVPKSAGGSLVVGTVPQLIDGSRSSVVLRSDQPLAVTLVSFPLWKNFNKSRLITNSMVTENNTSWIPSILKNTYNTNTILSIQNVDTIAATASIHFFDQFFTNQSPVYTENVFNIQPGAVHYIDVGTIDALGSSFNGYARVYGKFVVTAMEFSLTANDAQAFESIGTPSNTFYMPSAMCNLNYQNQSTSYAVLNTSSTFGTMVTVRYYKYDPINDILVEVGFNSVYVAKGSKASFPTCASGVVGDEFIGSAKIESSTTPIVAIQIVYDDLDLSAATPGFRSGSSKLALPYVRWVGDAEFKAGKQRTYIAVQNLGGFIPAGQVRVTYYDKYGNTTTYSLGKLYQFQKLSTTAADAGFTSFGYYIDGIGGSAIVQGPAGSQLAVVARVESYTQDYYSAAEDYNGIPIP
jgi:hypothetical protein